MSDRTCVVEACERKHYGRGWCQRHYDAAYRAKRHTDRPRELIEPTASLDQRLRALGWRVVGQGCWEWTRSLNGDGYGQLTVAGTPMIASRAAYLAWVGPIGPNAAVLHRCDNPPCINPTHLFLGTRGTNNSDARAKQRTANGERLPQHKLTDAQVVEIRATYSTGGVTQREIARDYGVGQQLISLITRGERRQNPTGYV